ncbi:MAG TPA: 50S ribosomal protein L15 [Candidatus Saccharimonadales bacterium]|nr:50S ribosomal protein L15 [Candidatus Saccharimonadales bacterium]
MKYNELKVKSTRKTNRVGRGIAAGQGKTAGRGTKGQGARTGSSKKPGFAGGSNPLMQKLPKLPGFRSHKPKNINVYTGQLNNFSKVDAETLFKAGLVASPYETIKLLVKGDLTAKVDVSLPAASQSAIALLEEKGGSFTKVERLKREVTKSSKTTKE